MADQIPFQEGIDFLAGKVNLPTQRYDDLKHAAHVRGYSVAGVTRDDMLTDFRVATEKARAEGTGFKEFQATFNEIVDRTGWKFRARGATDEERRAWRARIIYTTNMRTSYMAGRYKQLTDPDVLRYRPYWRYKHSGALHPRKLHLSWNNLILAATDPAWKVMYPPNGWGCGCDVEALSERQMRALGKSGPDQAPIFDAYESVDPRTGDSEWRIPGIDRGWDYNVGEEWLHGIVPTELRKPLPPLDAPPAFENLPELPRPVNVKASQLLAPNLADSEYAAAFLKRFKLGPEGGYHRDRSGGVIAIGPQLFEQRGPDGTVIASKATKRGRGVFAELLAEAIKDPDEIWVDWAKVKSGAVLRRAYLKRVELPDGRSMFIRFEWTSKGWISVTGFDTTEAYMRKYRAGALLYRRKQ